MKCQVLISLKHIYIYICVCVCVTACFNNLKIIELHTCFALTVLQCITLFKDLETDKRLRSVTLHYMYVTFQCIVYSYIYIIKITVYKIVYLFTICFVNVFCTLVYLSAVFSFCTIFLCACV